VSAGIRTSIGAWRRRRALGIPGPESDWLRQPISMELLPRGVRIVYVSLGTVFNDQPGVYRALVSGAVAMDGTRQSRYPLCA